MSDKPESPLIVDAYLRDQFAAACLQGYLASFPASADPFKHTESIAHNCYLMADAMLRAMGEA